MSHEHYQSASRPGPPKSAGFAGIGGNSLAELFPGADYRFQMRFQRCAVPDFFRPWRVPPDVLEQRRKWLRKEPAKHAALLPEGIPALEELAEQLASWPLGEALPAINGADPRQSLIDIGENLESDILLLRPDDQGVPRLWAGCVCFPSSWSLAEKMGQPMDFIHQPVPGLNDQLGNAIGAFLRRMAPGVAWLRANWGLSRSPELNQHPERALPRLDAAVSLDEVWLRVEHQALVALPRTSAVLFGIRVVVYPLAEVKQDDEAAAGLCRALKSMPEPMASYKGIAPARERLIGLLSE